MNSRQSPLPACGGIAPEPVTRILLALTVLTASFFDYWSYSRALRSEPRTYVDVLEGTAKAPNQYRVGVIAVADFVARHAHLALRHTLTLLDTLAGLILAFVLYRILREAPIYKAAGLTVRWFASIALLALLQFYLAWITWYQRPETMTSAALVAVSTLLLTVPLFRGSPGGKALTALFLVLIACAQGFVRADVAFALNAGIVLFASTSASRNLTLSRASALVAGALSAACAVAIQLYLMRVLYPHASYGDTRVLQLVENLRNHGEAISFLLFLPVYAWTVLLLLRRRARVSDASLALVWGSALFFVLWVCLGRIEEVRIFLPFAVALSPASVEVALQRLLPS